MSSAAGAVQGLPPVQLTVAQEATTNGRRKSKVSQSADVAIDLRSEEGIAEVAEFILGAANRMPDVVARHFEATRSWSSVSGPDRRKGSNRSRRWTSSVVSAQPYQATAQPYQATTRSPKNPKAMPQTVIAMAIHT